LRLHAHPPVVVTMIAVGVVQVAVDQVVGMVAVGNLLVAAAGAVLVAGVVCPAGGTRRAVRGVGVVHLPPVLLDVRAVEVVQVAAGQVVGMGLVANGRVATAGTVLVIVALVMGRHVGVSCFLRRWGRLRFDGMRQGVLNQVGDVPICQWV